MLKSASIACVTLVLVSGAAHAQGAPNPQFVELGGGMHALAKVCGGYTEAELTKLKSEQKAQNVAGGMSAAKFEEHFKAGYDKGVARIATATPAEKEKACAQAKQMMAMGKPQ